MSSFSRDQRPSERYEEESTRSDAQRQRSWYTTAGNASVAFTPFSPYFSTTPMSSSNHNHNHNHNHNIISGGGMADTTPLRRSHERYGIAAATSTTATPTPTPTPTAGNTSTEATTTTATTTNVIANLHESRTNEDHTSFDAKSIVPPPPPIDHLNRPVQDDPAQLGLSQNDMEAQFTSAHDSFMSKESSALYGKPGKKSGCWGRYRTCWLITVILAILGIVGGVVIWFYLPQIAQAFMDGSQVQFQSVAIMNPQPDSFE